mgnify:CR=1 FL=1
MHGDKVFGWAIRYRDKFVSGGFGCWKTKYIDADDLEEAMVYFEDWPASEKYLYSVGLCMQMTPNASFTGSDAAGGRSGASDS